MIKSRKYCPRCGALIHRGDTYCIRCGYNFRIRARGVLDLRTILIAVVILLAFWIGIRVLTKQPIVPVGIADFFKNITSNKTG